MRRIKAWLVVEGDGEWEDYTETPVMVFQNRERAGQCAEVRNLRSQWRDPDNPSHVYVTPVDVLLEEEP